MTQPPLSLPCDGTGDQPAITLNATMTAAGFSVVGQGANSHGATSLSWQRPLPNGNVIVIVGPSGGLGMDADIDKPVWAFGVFDFESLPVDGIARNIHLGIALFCAEIEYEPLSLGRPAYIGAKPARCSSITDCAFANHGGAA